MSSSDAKFQTNVSTLVTWESQPSKPSTDKQLVTHHNHHHYHHQLQTEPGITNIVLVIVLIFPVASPHNISTFSLSSNNEVCQSLAIILFECQVDLHITGYILQFVILNRSRVQKFASFLSFKILLLGIIYVTNDNFFSSYRQF